jgi:hypothetical protein
MFIPDNNTTVNTRLSTSEGNLRTYVRILFGYRKREGKVIQLYLISVAPADHESTPRFTSNNNSAEVTTDQYSEGISICY